jgi:hypothetical protein
MNIPSLSWRRFLRQTTLATASVGLAFPHLRGQAAQRLSYDYRAPWSLPKG